MKLKSTIVSAMSIMLLGLSTAYATDSSIPEPCDVSDIHCAGFSGKRPPVLNEGKWLKFEWAGSGGTYIFCGDSTVASVLLPEEIHEAIKTGVIHGLTPTHPVVIKWLFSQCEDKTCHQQKLLSTDIFKLSESQDEQIFTTKPQFYALKDPDNSYGETCKIIIGQHPNKTTIVNAALANTNKKTK